MAVKLAAAAAVEYLSRWSPKYHGRPELLLLLSIAAVEAGDLE